MKIPRPIPCQWPQTAFLVIWLFFLLSLLDGGRYQLFLRPEFWLTLSAGAVILLGMLLAFVHAPDHRPFTYGEALRLLILLTPLLFAGRAQEAGLDGQAYQKRSSGTPVLAQDTQETENAPRIGQASPEEAADAPPPPLCEIPPELHDPQAAAVTIADLCTRPELYAGKRVEFCCMALRDGRIRKDFGADAIVLFRFMINCCAADAIPVSLLTRGNAELGAIPDNGWIAASGVFRIQTTDGKRIPWLEQVRVRKIPAPVQPYLY